MEGIEVPRRRKVAADPHPDLDEAVTVSRFWANVTRSDEGCWIWAGSIDKNGYGEFFYHGRNRRAHELALSFTTGEKRHDSLDTCHSCDNPPCVNPGHLRFGTRQSNVDEMHERNRNIYGSRHPSTKLTEAEVLLIRERRALGARQKDLSRDFDITEGAIVAIVHGRNWKHVGGPITNRSKKKAA